MLEAATIARTDKPLNSASGARSSGRRAPGRGLRPTRGSPPPGRSLGQSPSGNALFRRVSAQRRRGNVICQGGPGDQLVSTASASCTTITAIRFSTAAAPLDSRPELARESAHRSYQLGNLAPSPERLATVAAMLPRMAVAERSAGRGSTVHPASAIRHRRGAAWRPSPRASAAPAGRVHGVVPRFRGHPLPPRLLDGADDCLSAIVHGDMLDTDRLLPGLPAMAVQRLDQRRTGTAQPVRLIQRLAPHFERKLAAGRPLVAPKRERSTWPRPTTWKNLDGSADFIADNPIHERRAN